MESSGLNAGVTALSQILGNIIKSKDLWSKTNSTSSIHHYPGPGHCDCGWVGPPPMGDWCSGQLPHRSAVSRPRPVTSPNLPDPGPASADPRTTARSWSRDPPRPRCPHQSLEVSTKFGSNFHSRYIKLHLKLGHCPQDPLQEFMKQPNSGGETMYVCLNTYWLCLLLIFPSLKVLGTFNKENAGILSEYSAKFCWHLY